MSSDAVALLELQGVAAGYACLDIMVKHSPVQILEANLIEPGKFLILYAGGVAEVEEAHQRVLEEREEQVISELLLPFAHKSVLLGLKNKTESLKVHYNCIAVVETKTIAGALLSVDRACKDALVSLVGLRVAGALGGKGFFVLEGAQHDIESAMETILVVAMEKGGIFHAEVIASPHPEAVEWMLKRAPFQLRSE